MRLRVSLSLLACLLPGVVARPAGAACAAVAPTTCENCFAVFIMPDIQFYTVLAGQPERGNHLDLMTRYACANRTAWMEPTTGKRMPILMLLQLGDLVQSGDLNEGKKGAGPLAQWARVDTAFDNLDACEPNVPYLVTLGNHDLDGFNYEGKSEGYNTYFGTDRWTRKGRACAATDACDWSAGKWFLGGGDAIAANSRNLVGEGSVGPPTEQPGRHRAARIEAPNGQPFLFLGLELALDHSKPLDRSKREGTYGDDLAWPRQILDTYPGVPTIVFHHSMFWANLPPDTALRWGPETFHSDSLTELPASSADLGKVAGMKDLYDVLLAPRRQVRFIFSGHVIRPTNQADYTIPRPGAPPVWGFLRNYQIIGEGEGETYGAGWNVIAVFDPDAEQVRVRSYRIDDDEAYAAPPVNLLHKGTPVRTECMDTDQGDFKERIIPWDFSVSEPTVRSPNGHAGRRRA